MDQVITYDKSLQERILEYKDVLDSYKVLPVSQIKKEWSFFVELSVDPNGWQAIWKIPRIKCEELNISFPTIVLTFVEDIYPKSLSALVKILAVRDDISIADRHSVPLLELWPMKEQDPTIGLNLESTANSLDMLRFFYQHVFMPWDYEEEDSSDWLHKHLEPRLRLYYDMKNGIIPRATATHISTLISEARRLQAKREYIESHLEEAESTIDNLDETQGPESKKIETLMDLHLRILQIGSEITLLENPLTRSAILRKQQEITPTLKITNSEVWLIAKKQKVHDYLDLLGRVKNCHGDEDITLVSELSSVLEVMNPKDTIILNKGKYTIKSIDGLEVGGILKGLYKPDDTLLVSITEGVMMDFSGDRIIIENLTIDASFSQCGVLVRRGKVTLKNCKMIGNGECSTQQGIIVLAGAEIELENCAITRFCTAIVGNSGSKILLKNCEIFNNNYGLKLYDKGLVKAENTSFHDCQQYGFCIETEKCLEDGQQKVGNFEILEIISDIYLQEVNGKNNRKGNVLINHMSKIKPLQYIFSQTDDSVLYQRSQSSDEEMDASDEDINKTVTEDDGRILSPITI